MHFACATGSEADKSANKGKNAGVIRRTQKANVIANDKELEQNAYISITKKNEAICSHFGGLSVSDKSVSDKRDKDSVARLQFAFNEAVNIVKNTGNHSNHNNHNNRGSNDVDSDKRLLRDFRVKMHSKTESDQAEIESLALSLSCCEKEKYGQYLLETLRNNAWLDSI